MVGRKGSGSMVRRIEHLVIHCSATSPGWNIGVDEIRALHATDPSVEIPWDGRPTPGFGWSDVGYHWVIRRDGYIESGRPPGRVGAHVKGYNRQSLGICLVGGVAEPFGLPEANFTRAQYGALEELLEEQLWLHKKAEVCGHRDFPGVNKACPSFNVKEWWYGPAASEDVPIIS
jgi:N-acetylmuramoyl-L-alanine amidase